VTIGADFGKRPAVDQLADNRLSVTIDCPIEDSGRRMFGRMQLLTLHDVATADIFDGRWIGAKHFHRHAALERRIEGLPGFAQRAIAQPIGQLIVQELL